MMKEEYNMKEDNNAQFEYESSPPSYESLYPDLTPFYSHLSQPHQHFNSHHSDGETASPRRRNIEQPFIKPNVYFLNDDSLEKAKKNQMKIKTKEQLSRLDPIDVYDQKRRSCSQAEDGRDLCSYLLHREENGTTFIKAQFPSCEVNLEYLLLPPVTERDVIKAIRLWLLQNCLEERFFRPFQIKNISPSYLWKYKLGTVCEGGTVYAPTTSCIEKTPKIGRKRNQYSTSKWEVEMNKKEILRPMDVHLSNTHQIKIIDCCYSGIAEDQKEKKYEFPDGFLDQCHGKVAYECTKETGEVIPITQKDCINADVVEISEEFLKRHQASSGGGRIIKQRHCVWIIPVYKVSCDKKRDLLIVGTNHKVFIPHFKKWFR